MKRNGNSQSGDRQERLPMGRVFRNNLYILGIALRTAPLTFIAQLTSALRQQVVVFFEHTYQIVFILECIQYRRPFMNVVWYVAAMFCTVVLNTGFGYIINTRIAPIGKEKIYREFRRRLYEKARSMDIEHYDNPEFYNDFVFAIQNASKRIDDIIEVSGWLMANVFMVFLLCGYIMAANPVSAIFVVAAFALTFLLRTQTAKLSFRQDKALNPVLRKRDYIARVFYLPEYAKELRMSAVKGRLMEDYAETEAQVYKELGKTSRKIAVLEFLRDYFAEAFIFDLAHLMYLMFMALVRGAISFGSLIGLYRSAQNAKDSIKNFAKNFAAFQEHSLYVEKVREFLAGGQSVRSALSPSPIPDGVGALELRNVSFAYPGAPEATLTDVSMSIKPGEKVAIVGYNGAGKTTLVKLLLRLYDPCGGEVRYAGGNIREYDAAAYRNLFATLFQDYQIYAATVAQNVLADDGRPDEARLSQALVNGGFMERVMQMPDDADSQLTREFTEGQELSGGETQKLATARSFYKDSRVIILDEPSSALDPIAEFELNNTMMKLGKTVVFISHRLSTTKAADRIYMLENGRLIECGKHDELMGLGGKYAEMFKLQAERYR